MAWLKAGPSTARPKFDLVTAFQRDCGRLGLPAGCDELSEGIRVFAIGQEPESLALLGMTN